MRKFSLRLLLMICALALTLVACGRQPSADAASNPSASAEGAAAGTVDGAALFERFGCIECHQMNGRGPGPSLAGVYGSSVTLESGASIVVDEAYIRTSILDPRAQTHAGYLPIMPPFAGRIDEAELSALVAYIRSL